MGMSDFYRTHADDFFARTVDLAMDELYVPFLARVPTGGRILDAGCGSGRDAKAFLARGYRVTAFDASPELAALAADLTGLDVRTMRFDAMTYVDEFDGIWSCASVLHVPMAEMPATFVRFRNALKIDGVWFLSFKYGEGESTSRSRLFSNFTETSLTALVEQIEGLAIEDLWTTRDVRPDRATEIWLNALVVKKKVA